MISEMPTRMRTWCSDVSPLFMMPSQVLPHRAVFKNQENVQAGKNLAAAGVAVKVECLAGTKLSTK